MWNWVNFLFFSQCTLRVCGNDVCVHYYRCDGYKLGWKILEYFFKQWKNERTQTGGVHAGCGIWEVTFILNVPLLRRPAVEFQLHLMSSLTVHRYTQRRLKVPLHLCQSWWRACVLHCTATFHLIMENCLEEFRLNFFSSGSQFIMQHST